jgi:hypothetical protein
MCAPRVTRQHRYYSQPKGTDHCSDEEYRFTRVVACVARTLEYRIDASRVTRGAPKERL